MPVYRKHSANVFFVQYVKIDLAHSQNTVEKYTALCLLLAWKVITYHIHFKVGNLCAKPLLYRQRWPIMILNGRAQIILNHVHTLYLCLTIIVKFHYRHATIILTNRTDMMDFHLSVLCSNQISCLSLFKLHPLFISKQKSSIT